MSDEVRRKAEARLQEDYEFADPAADKDWSAILQALRRRQAELEVQNEELRRNQQDLQREHTSRLTRMNEQLQQEVANRERAEEALEESRTRLEKVLSELNTTQQQVLQQERLAAVGQLAAGIAHDFNNILTSIIGFAELLQIDPTIPERMQIDLARIVEQGQRGAHLVRQILDFSRRSIRQPQFMNLVSFVKEAVRFLRRTFPENINISLEFEANELPVKADPVQLQQVLTNLFLNARDAMPGGGHLKVRLRRLTLQANQISPCPGLTPGEWVVCLVADTGTGIPEEVLPHIFEPFFTTKDSSSGTGLGLAQVYGIVQQHHGYIDVESQLGQGTAFTIYLPLRTAKQSSVEENASEMIHGQGELVLLVEDEPEVVAVGKAMLEYLDYKVLVASNGEQAFDLFLKCQDEIDLVVTDIVMPGMDGISLFQALQTRDPNLKVILMTGYPLLEEEPRNLFKQGLVHWLPKPLTLNQMNQVVNRALQTSRPDQAPEPPS